MKLEHPNGTIVNCSNGTRFIYAGEEVLPVQMSVDQGKPLVRAKQMMLKVSELSQWREVQR